MTNAPTPAGGRQFSGNAVLVVVGIISLVMCAIVIVLVRGDVIKAMDERSEEAIVFESVADADRVVAGAGSSWWQAALVIEDADLDTPREIPFTLRLPSEDTAADATIYNASEEITVRCEWDGATLVLDFPHYASRIEAEVATPGRLVGNWTKQRPSGDAVMPFTARRVEKEFGPFVDSETAPSGAGGEAETIQYAMQFDDSGMAKWLIQVGQDTVRVAGRYGGSDADRISATVLTPTGDYRFLSGARIRMIPGIRAERILLSVFDGAHAFLFDAKQSPGSRRFAGHFYSGNTWHETFTATRLAPGEDLDLPDAFSEVGLKPGETRLNLPQLDDPKYAGKPVIVKVMGTWCPNCHDATRLLVEYYDEYHDDGLEILGLAYEHTEDEARSLRQIARFKERLGATWEIVPAGLSDKKKTAATLPALTDIKSYPTTIFLNRDHTVEAIHSGFSGPATGAAHEKTREEFTRLIEAILGS